MLEIGTGSGYQTAVLAHLVEHVYTMERIKSLQFRPGADCASSICTMSAKHGNGWLVGPTRALMTPFW